MVEASLVADVDSIAPGLPFRLGVRFDIAQGWHVNWVNPGDVGLAPSVEWILPEGFVAGHMVWPYPDHYRAGRSVIFGYAETVVLWTEVTPPDNLMARARFSLCADVAWLACADSFVPGTAQPRLEIAVGERVGLDTRWDEARERIPQPPPFDLAGRFDEDSIVLSIRPGLTPGAEQPLPHTPAGVFFYPFQQGLIDNAAPQELRRAGNGFELRIERSRTEHARPRRLAGILVSRNGWSAHGHPLAVQVDIPLELR
jgi:thiol:disulfide interchange protein DsbD